MVSEPNRETQGGPLAFWRYMEGSLQMPDILYIGPSLYKGIPPSRGSAAKESGGAAAAGAAAAVVGAAAVRAAAAVAHNP